MARQRAGPSPQPFDPEKTTLITGGLSGLGALFARHLAQAHGARHLLLVSRSGERAEGAKELKDELEGLGAAVTIAACDVSERGQLGDLFAAIPDDHPLGAIFHSAGALENALVADLDLDRVDRVLAAKADAAWHLHELSAELELSHFVLFSSAAGLLGGPGQGNYAAANSFLDALAEQRQAKGLAATSLAWGAWLQETNLTKDMDEAQVERILRQARAILGFAPLPVERGLQLFEAAVSLATPVLAPVRFDRAALRSQAKQGTLPAALRGLVRGGAASRRQKGWLLTRLASAAEADRGALLGDAVRSQVATALGHASAEGLAPESTFPELGFDSLASLEMRDWVNVATGLQLPASVLFDYPTIESLVRYLEQQLGDAVAAAAVASGPVELGLGSGAKGPAEVVSIRSLYERAVALGRGDEAGALLAIAARLRPSFDLETYAENVPSAVRLSSGPAVPRLICVPSLLAIAGPHQYVGLAQHFAGRREVVVVPNPGFLDGELLPASTEAAIALQAAAVRQCADGEPYVLLGHSTGGLLAHAVAEHLDGLGEPPAGLIKVDTYAMAGIAAIAPQLLGKMKGEEEEEKGAEGASFELTDQRLTAMVAYRGFVEEVEPGSTRAAGLLVKAADPLPGTPPDATSQVLWEDAEAVLDVPGDHFTMMEEHVLHVARAIDEWLGETFPDAAPVRAT